MADYNRYRVLWTGGPGGNGVSTFFTPSSDTTALAALRAFFSDIASRFPNDITWSFPNSGDVLDMPGGTLIGGWTQTSASNVVGSNVGNFAAGVGCRVVWETGAIVGGRRVRGSTFLTSLASTEYDSDGSIGAAALTQIQNAVDTLVSAADLAIWSRANAGIGSVSSGRVVDKVSWLRSRRQ